MDTNVLLFKISFILALNKIQTSSIMKTKILNILLILSTTLFAQKIEWSKTYSRSNHATRPNLQLTHDNSFILGGTTLLNHYTESGDIAKNSKQTEWWLVKINPVGKLIWQKTYGGTDYDEFVKVLPTHDGGYLLGGYTRSVDGDIHSGNKGKADCWLVKVDASGKIEWEKTYGGSKEERLTSLIAAHDGGFIFTATTLSTDGDVNVPLCSGNGLWVVKISEKGVIEWKNCYANTGLLSENAMITSVPKGYMLTSSSVKASELTPENTISMNYNNDIRIYKLDKKGELLWVRMYGDENNKERIVDFKPTKDGGFAFAGCSRFVNMNINDSTNRNWDGWLVKLDSVGNIAWEKTFGGKGVDQFIELLITSKGFLMAGNSATEKNKFREHDTNFTKFWLLQTDINGNLLYDKKFDSEDSNFLNSIQPTQNGYILAGQEYYSDGCRSKSRIKLIKVRK